MAVQTDPVVVVGDLNVEKGRKRDHPRDEFEYIRCVERSGVRQILNGNTHTYNKIQKHNQLDYCFTNIPQLKTKIVTGVAGSDHSGIVMSFEISCEIFVVPEKYVAQGGIDRNEDLNLLIIKAAEKIVEADVEIGDAILELDIAAFELRQQVLAFRKIPEHKRVAGTSRQISSIIMNTDLNNKTKRSELKKLYRKEAARRLSKATCSGSFGAKIMVPLAMAPKRKQILECKIDPNKFKDVIVEEEKLTDHSNHEKLPPASKKLLKKLEGEELKETISSLRTKWGKRPGFSASFWAHIISKINTEHDSGVHSFSRVETVVKDPLNPSQMTAWRAVWKATSITEKLYDLAKSRTIDLNQLENSAYCHGRSTQRALTKAACWEIGPNDGLIGIDFKNAFGRICRPCINDLLGREFLCPNIEFEVGTAIGTSEKATSKTGSGAGRGTGGPGFIVGLEFHLDTNEVTIRYRKKTSAYADDSLVKVELTPDVIAEIIAAFKSGEYLGLFMHATGKKGPTLLVHQAKKDQAENMVEKNKDKFGCDVNVVTSVKFLGLQVFICEHTNSMAACLSDKLNQLLSFFISEINRSVRLTQHFTGRDSLNGYLHSVSQTTAALIESRIQYSICYLDRQSIATLYNLHRKAVCAISGKPFRFYGFKNFFDKNEGQISDL